MSLLVLGSGGREHALAWRLSQDPDVSSVLVAPGNPGFPALAAVRAVDVTDSVQLLALARREGVDLTVVGPEAALERGVADRFRDAGQPIVGPSQTARGARMLEGLRQAVHGATRGFRRRDLSSADTAESALAAVSGTALRLSGRRKGGWPGRRQGRDGRRRSRAEAEAAVRASMVEGQFGAAGSHRRDRGVSDRTRKFRSSCCPTASTPSRFGTAQDHKRIFDDDRGPEHRRDGRVCTESAHLDGADARHHVRPIVHPVHGRHERGRRRLPADFCMSA